MEQPDEQPGFEMLDDQGQASTTGKSNSRDPQRGEMLLGLFLILILIGWCSWVWRQQKQFDAYSSGKRYAAARDWDQALAGYREAGDYADSAALAGQVMAIVAERDHLYTGATEAIASEAWLVALQYLRNLRNLQPNYHDSNTLYSAAEDNTYRAALSGVVAQRIAAVPAGLYMRDDREWVWLTGSDATSSLLGYGPGGCLVYDVPIGGSNLDNTAANPNLFATSVLNLDLTPPSRGLMNAQIMPSRNGGSNSIVDAALDTTLPSSQQAGNIFCDGELARHTTPTSSSRLRAGITTYVADSALRARSDDGKVDLLLEQGVQSLFDTVP